MQDVSKSTNSEVLPQPVLIPQNGKHVVTCSVCDAEIMLEQTVEPLDEYLFRPEITKPFQRHVSEQHV
jgi:hypothetical protein